VSEIASYSKIYALGHREVKDIGEYDVEITEKIDGSQFSFEKTNDVLMCRSKGRQLDLDSTDKLFRPAIEAVKAMEDDLIDGWTYRGETLCKPKHNTLAYDRVPDHNIILFGVDRGEEDYLDYDELAYEARRLDLEHVQLLATEYTGVEQLQELLQTDSMLGGQKIEGVVIKAYGHYDQRGKTLMAKFVSEAFKEKHQTDWKHRNPGKKDILLRLIEAYRVEPRWDKAVQHMREDGRLLGEPKDIGGLIKELQADVKEECGDEIRDILFAEYWPKIARGITNGLPQWYKMKLAEGSQ